MDALLGLLLRNLRLLGVLSIGLCAGTWAIDLLGWVHPCVYCRTQRSAIGMVGVMMLLPQPRAWVSRYIAAGICFFGANISSAQIFLVVRNINDGEPFGMVNLVMATGALFWLLGQALLLFLPEDRLPEVRATRIPKSAG